jgi:hypothetical protein
VVAAQAALIGLRGVQPDQCERNGIHFNEKIFSV